MLIFTYLILHPTQDTIEIEASGPVVPRMGETVILNEINGPLMLMVKRVVYSHDTTHNMNHIKIHLDTFR